MSTAPSSQVPGVDAPALPDVEELELAAQFPAASRDAWEELVAEVLRKSGRLPADANIREASERLASTTIDGITIQPLYTRADASRDPGYPGVTPFVRGQASAERIRHGWDVRQRHSDPDPKASREAVLADLENGVRSLWLVVGAAGIATADLEAVLADVHLDLAPVVLDAGTAFGEAAAAYLSIAAERGVAPEALLGNLGADPLGTQARTGATQELAETVHWAGRCAEALPGVRAITVDSTVFHEAGASDAQELGSSLASGVAYLRAMEDAGLSLEQACGQLEFRYVAGADQFLTIAKMRAARRLWARVVEICAVPAGRRGQRQHAVTSWAMTTRRDPWVNMLRTTLACFGAGVGGADAVTVLPFDAAIGLPDAFARRIARNTQAVLIQESNLARVIDPAGGSWYVESLTEQLASKAWEWFQQVESEGGLSTALASGFVADHVATSQSARARRVATRKDTIIGVSEFPNLDEQPVERRASTSDVAGGLPRIRPAEPYEQLRDRSDASLASRGERPTVFLAGLGSAREQAARVGFAAGAVAAGGILAISSAAEGVESLTDEFAAGGTAVAVLCSSDAVYAEQAADAARALKARGAARVLLAGRPGDREASYRAAGIDGFLYAGADIVAALQDIYHAMEVR